VERLAADGFDVFLSAISEEERNHYDGPGAVSVVDLSEGAELAAWAASIGSPLHAACFIAGGFSPSPIESLSADTLDSMIDVNVRTAALSMAAFAPALAAANGASVVFIGAQAFEGAAGISMYAASKAAVVSLARSVALELQDKKVRVNSVLPNTIDTPGNRKAMPKTNFDTWAKPSEIAAVISFLVSPESSVVSGNAIRVGRTV
jgi:NAD(P)-dependent dehydrogenase (short-subunit alcohol dehydrogenase family)